VLCRFGDEYVTLKAQVLKTLCGAASPYDSAGKPQAKTTIYGGFVGIMLFGPKAIDAFLLPLVLGYWRQWEEELEKTQNLEARLELQMCQQVALVSRYGRGGCVVRCSIKRKRNKQLMRLCRFVSPCGVFVDVVTPTYRFRSWATLLRALVVCGMYTHLTNRLAVCHLLLTIHVNDV